MPAIGQTPTQAEASATGTGTADIFQAAFHGDIPRATELAKLNPAIAKVMKVEMKNLGSAEVQALSDADLAKIITDGKGKMKPVKSVTGPAVDNVVAYIRTLKK